MRRFMRRQLGGKLPPDGAKAGEKASGYRREKVGH